MKNLKILVVLGPEELQKFNFASLEGKNVQSITLLDQEDFEENVAQLLECNLIVNYTNESTPIIQHTLTVARLLSREVIHFSKLPEYVK